MFSQTLSLKISALMLPVLLALVPSQGNQLGQNATNSSTEAQGLYSMGYQSQGKVADLTVEEWHLKMAVKIDEAEQGDVHE